METYKVSLFRVVQLLGRDNILVKSACFSELSDAREIVKLWTAQLEKRGRKTEGTFQRQFHEKWEEETHFFYKGISTHYIIIRNN